MFIRNAASREISFDFWAGRQMTEDRSLLKMNFNRAFVPLNQATCNKVHNHIF
jgi:hypothetical protein